jgi:catechol 2,3-dioxygenase-like lactoylglutathione lyase family enzyme
MAARSGRPDYRLDHVAIGVPDATQAPPFLVGELGGRRHDAGPGAGFRWWQWRFEGGGVIEILAPDGPPGGFLHRFLAARGPGVHHVTFKVPDLHAAARRARDHGFEVVGLSEPFPGWKEAFLHPRQAQGIVVQLAESGSAAMQPPGAAAEWRFPAEPEPAPVPAEIVALRLAAASAERAVRQWGDLLGGSADARNGEILFTWPGSPLRVAVEVDADAPEGPLAIELLPRAHLRLPEGPHPTLGIPFRRQDGRAGH